MEFELKVQFVELLARFKKIDICASSASQLQATEIAVMIRASNPYMPPGGCASVSEIHQTLHISKAAVSQTLNALEKKGYITRKIDLSDRRKIKVTVTASGVSELEKAKGLYDELLDEVLNQFGVENTQTLIELVEKLIAIFEEMNRPDNTKEREKPL